MNFLSAYWLRRRQKLCRKLIKGSSIIDVGAGGYKIREDAIAVDIDRFGSPDVCASADYLPFRNSSADYISFLEVIEHLDFVQIDRMLREGKRIASNLLISTPNCDSVTWEVVWYIWSRSFGKRWHGAHVAFFGKKGLASLLETYGFKIQEMHTSRWHLLVSARRPEMSKSS